MESRAGVLAVVGCGRWTNEERGLAGADQRDAVPAAKSGTKKFARDFRVDRAAAAVLRLQTQTLWLWPARYHTRL